MCGAMFIIATITVQCLLYYDRNTTLNYDSNITLLLVNGYMAILKWIVVNNYYASQTTIS